MASTREGGKHKSVVKRTSQGGRNIKTASMNRNQKNSFKAYRGQGR